MSSYNPLDPFGIGVSMSVTGLDASAAANYTPSFALRSDPAIRRKKVALIVSWLEEHRGATAEAANKSFEEVLAAAKLEHIDQNARNEIYKDLKANPKILITDAEHMQYKATHTGLFNITDLQQYIARFTHGLPAEELNDAYQGVKEDIERLISNKTIYSVAYIEKNKQVLFPVQSEFNMTVDQDLKDMWNQVQMPKTQVELEEKLHAAGHLSDNQYRAGHLEKSRLMQAQIKLAAGQKLLSQAERRAKRRRYPQKLTNVHMLGQFEWFNAPGGKTAPATAQPAGAALTKP